MDFHDTLEAAVASTLVLPFAVVKTPKGFVAVHNMATARTIVADEKNFPGAQVVWAR